MILRWSDKEWRAETGINEAGYIHKLCVRRAYSGMGMPKKMIDFAKEDD